MLAKAPKAVADMAKTLVDIRNQLDRDQIAQSAIDIKDLDTMIRFATSLKRIKTFTSFRPGTRVLVPFHNAIVEGTVIPQKIKRKNVKVQLDNGVIVNAPRLKRAAQVQDVKHGKQKRVAPAQESDDEDEPLTQLVKKRPRLDAVVPKTEVKKLVAMTSTPEFAPYLIDFAKVPMMNSDSPEAKAAEAEAQANSQRQRRLRKEWHEECSKALPFGPRDASAFAWHPLLLSSVWPPCLFCVVSAELASFLIGIVA